VQEIFITAAIGYFLGSIPFGFILVRTFRGEDVRQSGSGNIGATNVARSSLALGIFTLLLDALKGFAAVLLTRELFPEKPILSVVAALFAIIGHMFPLWLKFRGGKGVATALGSFALLAPKSLLIATGLFATIVFVSRYVSLASMVVVILFPALVWWLDRNRNDPQAIALMAIASLLILIKHQGNIRRLKSGTESRFRFKRG
jgi:acyl phosphate:glycerol-3-phosphate acyltransferase